MAEINDKIVERAAETLSSKQERFQHSSDPKVFYSSVFQWVTKANLTAPVYKADTRKRDEWMQQFWRLEPHLAGVVGSVVAIDQNRNWNLLGGRNYVRYYANILNSADDGNGWREHAGLAALAYYTCDLGAIVEVGRTQDDKGNMGLGALWSVDSTRCKMLRRHAPANFSTPTLQYSPKAGETQKWYSYDYLKLTSLPQIEEGYNGVGYCAISRIMDLARIMVGVFEHDLEELRIAPPNGFLTANGITKDEFIDALKERQLERENNMQQFTSSVVYLISPDVPVDLKLHALSQLPRDFNMSDFVQMLMLGYALAFGYDASEFYSIKYAPLTNAGTSTKVQSQKATAKGELSFVESYRDALTRWLPETVVFEFDERSDEGDKLRADIQEVQMRTIATGVNARDASGRSVLPMEAARYATVETGMIPKEVMAAAAEAEEKQLADAKAEQQEMQEKSPALEDSTERARVRNNTWIRRFAEKYPNEPIVKLDSRDREIVIFESGYEMLKPRVWRGAPKTEILAEVVA